MENLAIFGRIFSEELVFRFLQVLGIIVFSYLVYRLLAFSIKKASSLKSVKVIESEELRKKAKTARSLLEQTLKYALFTISVLLILSVIAGGRSGLFVSASAVGIVIAFGAQNILKDILAGFFILFEGQYGVGDKVRLSPMDVTGAVEEFGIRTTKLRTENGETHYIPNGSITSVCVIPKDRAED